jgi:hypothetical protein
MLSKLKDTLAKLEKEGKFGEYKKDNPDAYLVSGFFMVEKVGVDDIVWQVDFYSKKTAKITSFVLNKTLEVKGEQDVFQEKKKVLGPLNLNQIKVGFRQCLDIVNELIDKKYPSETPSKIIVVLQMLDGLAVWNITYLTQAFKVLNVKVNAESGDVIKDTIENILSFKA